MIESTLNVYNFALRLSTCKILLGRRGALKGIQIMVFGMALLSFGGLLG